MKDKLQEELFIAQGSPFKVNKDFSHLSCTCIHIHINSLVMISTLVFILSQVAACLRLSSTLEEGEGIAAEVA